MRYSLKYALFAILILGVLLSFVRWHPLAGIPLTEILGGFLLCATLDANLRRPLVISLLMVVVLGISSLWIVSHDASWNCTWTPQSTKYELFVANGVVYLARLTGWEKQELLTWKIQETTAMRWDNWPGMAQVRRRLSMFGIEFARGPYMPPFVLQFRRMPWLQLIAIPFWTVVAVFAVLGSWTLMIKARVGRITAADTKC